MYKVLLVDDEPYVIEGLKTMGAWDTYEFMICGEATNGEDALELIEAYNPDLIFTDIKMPVMDGLQLIRQAREVLGSKAKFVILSGYDNFSYVQNAMRFGVTDYLLKPIDDQELNAIITTMGRLISEENHGREQIKQRLAMAANSPMKRILMGDASPSLFKRIQNTFQLEDDDRLRCILFEIDHYADWLEQFDYIELRRKKDEIKAIISVDFPYRSSCYLLETDENHLCLILSEQLGGDSRIKGLPELQERLRHTVQCSVSVAVSEVLQGLKSLELLFRQTTAAISYKFFKGEGSIIYYNEIHHLPVNYVWQHMPVERLVDYILCNDCDGLTNQIESLFQNFTQHRSGLEVIKTFIKNLEFEVIRLVLDQNMDAGEISSRFIKFNQKMDCTTIGKLKNDFLAFCLALVEYFNQIGQQGSKDVINAVKLFVKDNYHQDISLQKLAKQFYLNSAYLGQLFKKYTGMTYKDYLHQTRIDEAKKLLRRTDMKITEIAQVIGYNDPDYFVSKFKTVTRVTPSEFKKTTGGG